LEKIALDLMDIAAGVVSRALQDEGLEILEAIAIMFENRKTVIHDDIK
jgi:hypothetical protein